MYNVNVMLRSDSTKQLQSMILSRNKIYTPGTLRKHAYSNILKILPSKNENFQIKNSDSFQDSAQNILGVTRYRTYRSTR